ncbi:hypothetical protein [Roseisolibacter sp. H3M3-2]|uniref:hypothetical protein n=1 Tax=Roseisolibacter sp. H3M3-2 TaxID=3031323 RepID=UPI0023DA3B97|nr:hypothetical protein [Roseisolibacter sp. H3M3-2]MDF1502293.1 hypothetical protein [Roseisolibacter sp. H3M3-2]
MLFVQKNMKPIDVFVLKKGMVDEEAIVEEAIVEEAIVATSCAIGAVVRPPRPGHPSWQSRAARAFTWRPGASACRVVKGR